MKTRLFILTGAIGLLLGGNGLSAASCCGTGHAAHAAHEHGNPDGAAVPRSVTAPYLEIQRALAADTLDGVSGNAARLAAGWRETTGEALSDAEHLNKAKNIADARRHFHAVSNQLIARAKAHGVDDGNVREAHCPMAFGNTGASWLQDGEVLANPYYGASMLRCGVFRD